MEPRKLHPNEPKTEALKRCAGRGTGLSGVLAGAAWYGYYRERQDALRKELTALYGKSPAQITPEEFWCPRLEKAVAALAGPELAERFPRILALRLEGQLSDSPWRRSYRSQHFAFYADEAAALLCRLIRLSCYRESTAQMLLCTEALPCGFEYLLAQELRSDNREIIGLLREAVTGDNSRIRLSREMIEAIVISGHEDLLADLEKLLLAARLQEGLRQQILESADKGTVQTLTRFIRLCIDHDLFRYSAVIRAFDTWTGLGYGDARPAAIRQYALIAWECLTDEARRSAYARSENNVEAYFALWAQGCRELLTAYQQAAALLEDPMHYRRVLGWLFITRSDSSLLKMQLSSRYLDCRDEEILAWVVQNLTHTWNFGFFGWNAMDTARRRCIPNEDFPHDREARRALFRQLEETAAFIGNRKRTFTGNPFEFVSVTLESEPVYRCMLSLAAHDLDDGMIERLLVLAPNMTTSQRQTLIRFFLLPDRPAHREFLHRCLSDRSIAVKELAVEKLETCRLDSTDLELLADGLRSKSSDLRSRILAVFRKQDPKLLSPLLSRLLKSPEENQLQAAIELLSELKEQDPQLFAANRAALESLRSRSLSTQTRILLDPLLGLQQEEEILTPENGYGIFDPAVVARHITDQAAPAQKAGLLSRLLGKQDCLLSARELKASLPTLDELYQVLERMDQVFQRHAEEEIEVEYLGGSRQKVLFGNPGPYLHLPAESGCRTLSDPGARLDMVPFWEEFREALGDYARDVRKMLGLYHLTVRLIEPVHLLERAVPSAWYLPIAALDLAPQPSLKQMPYKRYSQMLNILNRLPTLFDSHAVFAEAIVYYRSMIAVWGEENLAKPYLQLKEDSRMPWFSARARAVGLNHRMIASWRYAIRQLKLSREDFALWFPLEYRLEQLSCCSVSNCLSTDDYFRACHENLIPRDVLIAYLLDGEAAMPAKIKILTNPTRWSEGRDIYEAYPFARELVGQVIHRIVRVEAKRGELPTPLTNHCLAIERFEGAAHFCNLLAALGKENFFRGYEYSRDNTKRAVLSLLLKRCYPAKGDTPAGLAALLKATDISDKRLAEAVMYAPQWAGFAEEILGWPGLKCGVWFFHAHINESFSAEKETEAAIYSPISPQQFNDGAFDKNWFFEAYNQLGEKRFQILYKSAKYITSGSNQHRRSQLYSDAVLGRLDAGSLMQEITEKRNQEKLRCYPLIPIAEGDAAEALRRYEFIQKFRKESRQFGAQRRDSEKKACDTAMENLAITTGLMDVNRLMWQMESRKIEEIRPLMEPVSVEDVTLRLTIDDSGDAAIFLEKNGKPLKTVPKSLNKHETYLNLKATVKELKDLKRRSRESMERAMTECTRFGIQELENICTNPILAPMLRRLVWTDGEICGFLRSREDGLMLEAPEGFHRRAETLRIAHPHDLRRCGQWARFMRLLYEEKLVQPFKQVFREYYPITEDERQERTISRRYAGHQVQPQRTVALLKGRGWTVDYEEGLQKVFYQENLIVRMYAMADWFSPADIEAPTLETVEFFDRSTRENVPLEQVPPILFSETMRDLDLVVSVAHAGGVDPEASHSTVEMRIAIAGELAALLKLRNVSWTGSHARIQGTLGTYSVHMGSGVVHAEGVGMVSILPVHSQARGRIFLPFADEDPKTAEIMSKILLLAEDQKIKDPSILRQITG